METVYYIYIRIYLSIWFFWRKKWILFINSPTVVGRQANETYYISMVPLKLLTKLFIFEQEDIDPEFRAQRIVNKNRIPVIANYILENRDNYVFSAIAASVDGEMRFISIDNNIGFLEIAMDAKFLINDGQHRKKCH